MGFSGGYSESQIDKNVFKVSFKGNGYTSMEKATDLTLLRSAELAIKSGYKYFVIIDKKSYTSNSIYTTPSTVNYYNSMTTVNHGQTYNISKPNTSNTIVCFEEKPKGVFSYNANYIFESITEKYDIEINNRETTL